MGKLRAAIEAARSSGVSIESIALAEAVYNKYRQLETAYDAKVESQAKVEGQAPSAFKLPFLAASQPEAAPKVKDGAAEMAAARAAAEAAAEEAETYEETLERVKAYQALQAMTPPVVFGKVMVAWAPPVDLGKLRVAIENAREKGVSAESIALSEEVRARHKERSQRAVSALTHTSSFLLRARITICSRPMSHACAFRVTQVYAQLAETAGEAVVATAVEEVAEAKEEVAEAKKEKEVMATRAEEGARESSESAVEATVMPEVKRGAAAAKAVEEGDMGKAFLTSLFGESKADRQARLEDDEEDAVTEAEPRAASTPEPTVSAPKASASAPKAEASEAEAPSALSNSESVAIAAALRLKAAQPMVFLGKVVGPVDTGKLRAAIDDARQAGVAESVLEEAEKALKAAS